ncbi:MAG: 4-hydroxybenzoate 3-monooxygenase [Xanthobacteraceae bacterium]|nr:4-hydroxybenzoate 3-monooxygenase [Xanthobacteraceae bacterium]MCW5678785.1 4-hydroxybenzoate 3-monooxygenase [Xanthobacteraceae bacterium]
MRTQVGIVGAGPAGLMLSLLLHRAGISSVIIENRSRAYVEARVRAGVLEHWTTELMNELGVGDRLRKEGLVHEGIDIGINGERRRIDFKALVNKTITIYGQQEVVKDLIAARLAQGGEIVFEVTDTAVDRLDGERPVIRYKKNGEPFEIECDFIAGCDGFHGICRPTIPAGVLNEFDRIYPYGWLGILSESQPVSHELIYSHTDRGFALFTMRSNSVSRLYLQVDPDEDINKWPDEEIWKELKRRIGPETAAKLQTGRVFEKGITAMRSFVVEPMQFGRLFLAGDAAHIVPPTGAKGMNLAIADVLFLSRALDAFYKNKSTAQLDGYTAKCLNRIWKAQRFSYFMTTMLHLSPNDSEFDHKRQIAELDYVTSSKAASTALAENYVGLPVD